MRVQVLNPDPLENSFGGLSEHVRNIYKNFKGVKIDIICTSHNQPHFKLSKNVKVYGFPPINHTQLNPDPLLPLLSNQANIVDVSYSLPKPDIVHALDWSTSHAGRLIAKRHGIPLIFSMHLSTQHSSMSLPEQLSFYKNYGYHLEMDAMVDAYKIIHVSTEYAKQNTPQAFLSKTEIVHNAIDAQPYDSFNKIDLPGKRKKKVLFIGRLAEMKNVHTLIECNFPNDVDLLIAGSESSSVGAIFDRLKYLSENTDYIHYLGHLSGQEKINTFKSVDAVIVPSIHEPFGIVCLEALASETPLIASFQEGMKDFLHEDFAINCGTTKESIEIALQKFSNMPTEQLQQQTTLGRKVVDQFHTWSERSNKLRLIYKDVYRNRRKPR